MTGYLPQYELAAWSIMRHLRDQTLESVRLGDPRAGRVDDFIVLSLNAVDGYSVKWSESRDTVTYRDFVKPREKAPGWIAQLTDGWKRLREDYPNRRVAVHLVTCDIPSKGDTCPGDAGKPFASFYHEAWMPFQSDGRNIPKEWEAAWEGWQRASGLDADTFSEFARACQLDFHARTAADRTFISRDDALLSTQLKVLAAELANIVRDASRQVEIPRVELLRRVGWSHLLEFKHRHEFPTRDPYEPIDSSVHELSSKLRGLGGGYLALLGSPGSGKSTLLTRTLEAGLHQHRLVKYYAYVPESADPQSRGESVNFLHDLVLSLERAGFSAGQSQGIFDRSLLLDRLHRQLQMLGTDFVRSGFPTVILIDGLDHIPREQNPQHSLIADLPLPDQVPAGVYFVLGSQTDDLAGLPPAVRQSIQEPGRRVQISTMKKEAALKVIAATELRVPLSAEQQERVVALAGGHPLALSLLLNRVRNATSTDQAASAIDEAAAFTGDVDAYYFAYWEHIESRPELALLLGLLARLRRPIDVDWVASWKTEPPLAELRRRFGHFFREERPRHLIFFHNSFRQYVLTKSEMLRGGTAEAADRWYHRQLAEHCEPADPPNCWEVVYHLAMARESSRVLEITTPEYFRQQLQSLRPIRSITRDARHVAAAAGQLKDVPSLVKVTFFLAELAQRAFSLDAWAVGEALLSMGQVDNALEYLWEGNELQIADAAALRAARGLIIRGNEPLARRVFEAAEPFSLIQPAGEGEEVLERETSDLLQRWAEAAPLFRPIDEVVGLIKGFVPPKSGLGESIDASRWRATLFFWAARSMDRLRRGAEAAVLGNGLQELEGDRPDLSVWLSIHRLRDLAQQGNTIGARAIAEELLKAPSFSSFSDHAKLLIAQYALTLSGATDAALAVLKAVAQPSISFRGMAEPSFSDALEFFRFHRLLMLTGGPVSPATIAPDPDRDDDWPRVLLQRSLVQLAKISADAAFGRAYSSADIRREFRQPLRLFQRTAKERRRWRDFYRVEQLRNDFDRLLVEVVQEHGVAATEELRREFERLWADSDTARLWLPDARRNVVMALYDAGAPEAWARSQLKSISASMLDGKDVSGKAEACKAQAAAWHALRDVDAAMSELRRMVAESIGVGYRKDYQMVDWVGWLDGVMPRDPAKVGERIALLAACIAATEETTEGRGTQTAALDLIKACVTVSPRRSVALIHWFEKHGCINRATAIAALLQAASERRLCQASLLKAIYKHLLLRFTTDAHSDLAKTLLTHCAEGVSREAGAAQCRELVEVIAVHGLPTSRPIILRALAEAATGLGLPLAECGLDPVPPVPKEANAYHHTLTLQDGTTLGEQEAHERAMSVDGFIDLVEHTSDPHHRWDTLLKTLLPELSRADAVRLAQAIPPDFRDSLALSSISRRLSELGDRGLAWQIGERALESSRRYGWAQYVDGGTRFEALRALVAANERAGRERTLQVLTSDLSEDPDAPRLDIARRLIDIIPLLPTDLKPEAFYPVVEDYVKLLGGPLHLLEEATDEFSAAPADDNCERALCELIAIHMAELVPLIAQGAMRALVEFLRPSGSPAGERCIKAMLSGTEFQQAAAVTFLTMMASESANAATPYTDLLRNLVLSRNWWIGMAAERLCTDTGLDSVPRRPPEPLPPIYLLALPPTADKSPSVGPDEPLPDSKIPRDMLRPYDLVLGIMAEMANLDEESVLAAAVREMADIADIDDLTARDELAYRSRLERAGVQLPYRRRRGAVAREAMRRVAGRLVDGGRVHPENLAMLLRLVASSDPRLALIEPVRRPTGIMPLDGLSEYGTNAAKWVEEGSANFGNHLRCVPGRVVLAEVTKLKTLQRSAATETRTSLVASRSLSRLDEQSPFARVFHEAVDHYPDAVPDGDDPAEQIVVRNQWFGADTDGTDWIALNPEIARRLGWTLAREGLFRWVDASGVLVAETLWWKDGCVELPPYQANCEVGEGFLLVATPEAAAGISKHLTNPTRFTMVHRSCVTNASIVTGPALQGFEVFTV